MPARVEYRLGSIFDVQCDILVIPASAEGTVTTETHAELLKAGLPMPPRQPWGQISVVPAPNSRYRQVVFVASTAPQTSTPPDLVEKIGLSLGLSAAPLPTRISAPLLGTGAGNLAPLESATALERGFLKTAPDSASLVISILDPGVLKVISPENRHPVRNDLSGLPSPAGEETHPLGHAGLPDFIKASTSAPLAVTVKALDAAPAARPKRTRVFISYSHADAEWLERLQKHLRPLEREGAMVWADTRIKAGAQWREEIRAALAETKVAVLLVSADFMASEFIVTNELPLLLKAAEEEGATILPVIISASSFLRTPSLSRFQAVNNPDKPLVQLRKANREKVLDDVARAVEDALKR